MQTVECQNGPRFLPGKFEDLFVGNPLIRPTGLQRGEHMLPNTRPSARKPIGLGFIPEEARHGFLVHVPKGNANSEMICISEHRGDGLGAMAEADSVPLPTVSDPSLWVLIDRLRCLALVPAFWEEASRRLRANGLPSAKFQKNPAKPIPVHPSLGKELCILCWAVEEASPEDIKQGVSQIRNPVIARVFRELELVEEWGSGIPGIFRIAKEENLPEPTIEELAGRVRFTVPLAEILPLTREQSRRGGDQSAPVTAPVIPPLGINWHFK